MPWPTARPKCVNMRVCACASKCAGGMCVLVHKCVHVCTNMCVHVHAQMYVCQDSAVEWTKCPDRKSGTHTCCMPGDSVTTGRRRRRAWLAQPRHIATWPCSSSDTPLRSMGQPCCGGHRARRGGGLASSAPHHQEDERASSPGHVNMGTERCVVAF